MASETAIANQALSRLGETGISSFDANTPNAITVRLHYDTVRDSLLRAHPWNFATGRAELTQLATTPDFGWAYQYQLPSDWLRLSTLNGTEAKLAEVLYTIEGEKLLTDTSEAKVTYVKRVTDTTLFDALFVDVLILRLAAAIAIDVTQSKTKRDEMLAGAERMLNEGRFVDANETDTRTLSPLDGSQGIAARGAYGLMTALGGQGLYGPTIDDLTAKAGADGSNGWTPAYAIVDSGSRIVIEITGWTGGTGDEPSAGYIGPIGLVGTTAAAVDISGGGGGGGSGDVVGPASSTDGDFAEFDSTTGKLLKVGGGSKASDFATAAQGTLADSAIQTADIDTLAEVNAIITDATLVDTGDSRFSDSRAPTNHASDHTDGTDDIQDATASVKGLATATQITKLDGIEVSADVTDATNVASALTLTGDVTSSASMATTIAAGAVDIAMLSASGTADGTTVLHGDNTWATPSGSGDALVANPLSQFAATTSLQLKGVLSDETGSGAVVFGTSPTLVTPALGTPSALVGTNITGTAAGLTAGAATGQSGTNTGDEPVASATVSGTVELATIAEVDTGTDTVRAITPAGLAGSALQAKLDLIEDVATADLTGPEIKTLYELESDTNAFDDAAVAKLGGVEALADVTDATNVGSALTLTGDVTSSGSMATTIAVDAVDIAMLSATGTASGSNFLRGDNTWAAPAGGGDVIGPASAVDDRIVTFNGTSGTSIQDGGILVSGLATSAQGTAADAALPKAGGQISGNITCLSTQTVDGRDLSVDGSKLDAIEASADVTDATNVGSALTLTGDVTSSGSMATTIAAGAVDIAMLSASGTADGTTVLHGDNTWAVPGGGGDALVANPLSQFSATSSSQLAGVLSDETGSGAAVFSTSPTLVSPILGTPTSGVATNLTGTAAGLTAGNTTTNANLTGHVTSSGNAAVLGSFTAAQLSAAISDETLSGSNTGDQTSVSGNAGTVTNGVYTTDNISALSATTSAQLAGVLSDETGTDKVVFSTSPTLVTPILGTPTSGVLTNATGYHGDSSLVTSGALNSGSITSGFGAIDNGASPITTTGSITGAGTGLTDIDLTTAVTGVLPVANFTTGTPTGSKFVRDDGSLQSIPGGGDALVSNPLSQFAATTSAQLAGVLSDETGSGAAVFGTSPTLVTPALGTPSALVGTNITGTAAGLTVGATTGVEAGADVTDATNVNAAGATMNTDSTMVGNTYFLDEDDMSSDSATKVASQQSIKAYVDTGSPAGMIAPYAGSSAPGGWLIANGATVSRTTYAALYAVTGDTYGNGDGSTTFELPDIEGRVIAGLEATATRLTTGGSATDGGTLGATGGAQDHTLVEAEMPAHNHSYTLKNNIANRSNGAGNTASNTSTQPNTGSAGGDGAHFNVQPTIILNYIIKT
jgi:microcystin-dependent protein